VRSSTSCEFAGRVAPASTRGYHWVEVNGDFVLAAVATDIILDTLLTAQ